VKEVAARAALLAVWGKNNPFFPPAGAQAFTRDNPAAVGHFALETHAKEMAQRIREFLAR
jgi:pimeloyl-ACP methyl ester carboxylesterase